MQKSLLAPGGGAGGHFGAAGSVAAATGGAAALRVTADSDETDIEETAGSVGATSRSVTGGGVRALQLSTTP